MSRAALEPGQVLDETYRIIRRIGEGGMGEVYEVAHARLAGRYAVKLLQKEVAEDPGLLARFQREAEVTSSLRHPNIVQVVDFRRLPAGTSYIVMEYLDGADLAAEIRRVGALPLDRVRRLVEQIATGLAAAHEQGIVHRDLKPANLFLIVLPGSRRELVKIVDFGISKVRAADTQLTRTATVMGTPQYMAPEQALGQSDRIDARSDQFALATITYEMVAGRCAFAGDTIPTVLYQLVHVEPPPLSVAGHPVHPAIDAVVRRGLAKQPEARFPSVLEFAHAFDAAVAEALAGGARSGAVASTMAAAPTALAPSVAPSSPGLPSSGTPPPGQALTTLGASAHEAGGPAAAATSGASGDGAVTAPGQRRVKWTLVLAGAAAAALALVIVLVASRGRSPRPAGPAVPVAPSSTAAAAAGPAARALAVAPRSGVAAGPAASASADEVTISVEDGPRDLVVSVDGESVRPPPVRLLRDSGKHTLHFDAPGYRPRTMRLDSTKDLAIVLSLKRKRGGGAAVPSAVSVAPAPPAAPAAPPMPASDPRAASAYVPPTTPSSSPSPPPPPPAPEKRKAGRFRHGVDAVSDFAKRHFGTAGGK
jgi:tRNA A-37 threonylcarbamoyl transferase component Bud32